mmetsp:Transcript_13938/g.33234  ORF Transcript_13938/g.33234 Transcript_13938/m.33234 type:complete len:296 (+) Transcript_13938:379-1266(+)
MGVQGAHQLAPILPSLGGARGQCAPPGVDANAPGERGGYEYQHECLRSALLHCGRRRHVATPEQTPRAIGAARPSSYPAAGWRASVGVTRVASGHLSDRVGALELGVAAPFRAAGRTSWAGARHSEAAWPPRASRSSRRGHSGFAAPWRFSFGAVARAAAPSAAQPVRPPALPGDTRLGVALRRVALRARFPLHAELPLGAARGGARGHIRSFVAAAALCSCGRRLARFQAAACRRCGGGAVRQPRAPRRGVRCASVLAFHRDRADPRAGTSSVRGAAARLSPFNRCRHGVASPI